MTIKQEPTNLASKVTSSVQSVADNFKGVGTLRRRLLISVLPAVLIPLAVASAIGYNIIERRAKTQVLQQFETNAVMASTVIAAFLRRSFETMDLVAVNPEVVQAMKAGNNKAQEQELVQQPIADLEKQFAATKLLTVNDRLNNYLQQIVGLGQVAEIFFTERNGFNVAYSNPTSDFVQSDESWWKISQQEGLGMDEPEFDESANATVIPFSRAVKDPQTGEFLGVIKAGVPTTTLASDLASQFSREKYLSDHLQIVDPDESFVLFNSEQEEMESTVRDDDDADDNDEQEEIEATVRDDDDDDDDEEMNLESTNVIGGKPIVEVIETLVKVEGNSLSFEAMEEAEESEIIFLSLEEAQKSIAQRPGFSEVRLRQEEIFSETSTIATFRYQNNIYTLSTVPKTDFVSIDVVDYDVVAAEARNLLVLFALTAIFLGSIALGLVFLLARQITKPLTNLSATTQEVAKGNLDVEASLEGTLETRTLANNFNNLVKQVKESLQTQQALADEQRQEKEQLEAAIYTLIDEISDATEGDLTVRANLNSIELSTVADLFNAIIANLQEIAIEAKQSSSQVGSSLRQNEEAIRLVAEQAIAEAKETRDTLMSVEQMSQSIQAIAANASQAEQIVDDTYSQIVNSTDNMDLTVNSILELRTTVGETAKKMKRLGESSQRISQAVSFIEEIALKTNVLAINASVEAGRAGEYGQGFTIVAEQVGALAEQSAAATKEIASIVAAIQAETQEVNQAMESGTAQVVETTLLVESTKESLRSVLEKSQEINQLMGFISQTTVSQANTSQNVTNLMQKIAQLSETTSISSKKVAQSIVETAQVAQKLEAAVAQFKVAQSSSVI